MSGTNSQPGAANDKPATQVAAQAPAASGAKSAVLSLVFEGMTATGTLAVAVLAIFGQRIRNWFARPKIQLQCDDKHPFVEKLELDDTSSSGSKKPCHMLRIKIQNNGKETARNCMIYCDTIYGIRAAGNSYYKMYEFVPQKFFWTNGKQLVDVVHGLPCFLDIAEIAQPLESSQAQTDSVRQLTGVAEPISVLQVRLEVHGITGRFYQTTGEKILLPIVVYADNLPRAEKKYVEICWHRQNEVDLTPGNFQIKLWSEIEGLQLVGGES